MSEKRIPDFIEDSHQLSSEEFCRQLSVWFEDRGLISDLRAHLRSQMITALRGTSIGAKPSQKTASPKFQAINMLIAEFLLQQEHHYTLSVFTSEVPLQEFVGTPVGNLCRGNVTTNDEGPPRFHRRDIWDILETLGLSPDSEESNRVYSMYQENQREALLTCIFRNLPALSKKQSRKDQCRDSAKNMNEPMESFEDEPSKESARNISNVDLHNSTGPNQEITVQTLKAEIANVLNQSKLKTDRKCKLQERIELLIKLENARVQREAEQKYERELVERERHIQASLIQRDNLFKRCLSQSELKILQERRAIEKEKKEMADVAVQLRESHAHVTRSFNELEERQEILRTREVEMERLRKLETARFIEQASELDIQKRKLDQEFKRLEEEHEETDRLRKGVHQLRSNLDVANHALSESQSQLAVMNDLQHQCAYLRRELHSSKHYLKQLSSTKSRQHSVKQVDKTQQTEETVDSLNVDSSKYDLNTNEMCQHLQQENAELRARSDQQEERIRELTTRVTHLAMEVELAQTAHASPVEHSSYHTTTSFVASESGSVLPIQAEENPPPPPPPLPPTSVTPIPSYRGGGEDLAGQSSVLQTVTPRPTRQRSIEARETRRKPPKRLVIHNPTSSEESSPTDEVLQEARRRLRRLEEESAEVDRRFKDFKRRQVSFFETAASVLRPNVQTAPPDNHRLSDLSNHQSRSNYTPSIAPTFYGASSSGFSHTRHSDMLTKPSVSHIFHGASSSRAPQFSFDNVTNNNRTPYFDRLTDIFQSSPSSGSDSSNHVFSYQTPSNLKMSPSVTKQNQTLESYESRSNRNTTLPANTDHPSSPYKRKGVGLSSATRETGTSLTANSTYIKQHPKKVQFVQLSDVTPSTSQSSSLPNLNLTTDVVRAELTSLNMQEDDCNGTSAIECNAAILSCPSTESNYVERYELQQVLLTDETSNKLENQDQNAPSVQEQPITKPENVLQDAELGFKSPDAMLHTPTSDAVQAIHPPTSHNESASQESEDDIFKALLPQSKNVSNNEVGTMRIQEDNKLEISNATYALKQLDINEKSALPSSAMQDCDIDNDIPQEVNLDELVQNTDLAKISPMAQSGSGSGFASSVGRISFSSIAMSSDTQGSNAPLDEAQPISSQSSNAQSSETESVQVAASIPQTTNAQHISATLNDAHVTDEHSSNAMSAPDERDQSDDDFWV